MGRLHLHFSLTFITVPHSVPLLPFDRLKMKFFSGLLMAVLMVLGAVGSPALTPGDAIQVEVADDGTAVVPSDPSALYGNTAFFHIPRYCYRNFNKVYRGRACVHWLTF